MVNLCAKFQGNSKCNPCVELSFQYISTVSSGHSLTKQTELENSYKIKIFSMQKKKERKNPIFD